MKRSLIFKAVFLIGLVIILHACSPAGGNNTGHEFMPDMGHSIAYEANYYNYYSYNTWGTQEDYMKYAMPRTPVKGTIPRGYAGQGSDNMAHIHGEASHAGISITANGNVPYYYEDTEEARAQASADLTDNPFPISDEALAVAKPLYNVYCGICHGEKGDGGGYLVRDDGGVYPAQPANFLSDEFIASSNGRYYHAIMYGKNVMGGYADKLSYEERWQVIHYIRSLQAKEKNLAYNGKENTLNDFDVPESRWGVQKEVEVTSEDLGEQHSDNSQH